MEFLKQMPVSILGNTHAAGRSFRYAHVAISSILRKASDTGRRAGAHPSRTAKPFRLATAAKQTGEKARATEGEAQPKIGKVKPKELAIFTRQFSVMIDAGLPLVQCLEILASQQQNKLFQKVLTGTRGAVEGGSTLSAAMKQYPKVFDPLYSNMVEAGETGGILDTILQRLSSYIEKNVKLKAAV